MSTILSPIRLACLMATMRIMLGYMIKLEETISINAFRLNWKWMIK